MIASRESQYKILHFHHAGLDKLAEVFQQWKCCRETQLKDQVEFQSKNACLASRNIFQLFLFSEFSIQIFFSFRCQLRNPACSFPSRGPLCRRLRPIQRRSFIGGWTSPPGCVTSTTMGRWRRNISFERYVCVHMHVFTILWDHVNKSPTQLYFLSVSVLPLNLRVISKFLPTVYKFRF